MNSSYPSRCNSSKIHISTFVYPSLHNQHHDVNRYQSSFRSPPAYSIVSRTYDFVVTSLPPLCIQVGEGISIRYWVVARLEKADLAEKAKEDSVQEEVR